MIGTVITTTTIIAFPPIYFCCIEASKTPLKIITCILPGFSPH